MGKQDVIKREKFSTQIDSRLLKELRQIARQEGRQIQSVLEEAVGNLLETKGKSRPNSEVMDIADSITKRYAKTLEMLAK